MTNNRFIEEKYIVYSFISWYITGIHSLLESIACLNSLSKGPLIHFRSYHQTRIVGTSNILTSLQKQGNTSHSSRTAKQCFVQYERSQIAHKGLKYTCFRRNEVYVFTNGISRENTSSLSSSFIVELDPRFINATTICPCYTKDFRGCWFWIFRSDGTISIIQLSSQGWIWNDCRCGINAFP